VSTEELEKCFLNWVKFVFKTSKSKIVPIDGKTLRRSVQYKKVIKQKMYQI